MIVFETIGTGSIPVRDTKYVPVAQWIRAARYERAGRGFKSLQAYQKHLTVLFSCLKELETYAWFRIQYMSYLKSCTRCHENFDAPLDKFFHKRASSPDGYQQRCKTCTSILHRSHYEEKTDYYKQKATRHNKGYRKRNQEFLFKYLSQNPCVDCGESNPMLLEFDHRENKSYDVSTMLTLSEKSIQDEIAKCDIRCANCHRMKTAIQFGWYKNMERFWFNKILEIEIVQKEHIIEAYERDIRNAEKIVRTQRTLDGQPLVGSLDPFKDNSFQKKQISILNKQIGNLRKLIGS